MSSQVPRFQRLDQNQASSNPIQMLPPRGAATAESTPRRSSSEPTFDCSTLLSYEII